MKDADRQKWLTAYLFAPLALVIVFMMMVVASFMRPNGNHRRHRRYCYRSNVGGGSWRFCHIEER